MKTLQEKITALKIANPKLYSGSDEIGYIELTEKEYESRIEEWAKNLPPDPKTDEEIALEKEEIAVAKMAAEEKLAALGLTIHDLKALGLA